MTEDDSLKNEEEKYDRIVRWCKDEINNGSDFLFDPKLFRDALRVKSKEWDFPNESLNSLIRNLHLSHIKVTSRHVQRNIYRFVDEYVKQGVSILDMAKRQNYSPYMFSRYIVEQITLLPDGKKGLTRSMRDPLKVLGNLDAMSPEFRASELHRQDSRNGNGTTRLAFEVQEALAADPLYGPTHDRWRHTVGIEYEVALEEMLKSMDIPFETESQLRDKGSSRTPDIFLQCPIAVKVGSEWRVICWIDSKAMYGDSSTHSTSVLPQAEAYVHRFGSGMILYWFGHAPLSRLGDANGDLVIQGWELPEQFLWPTGELGNRPPTQEPNT